MSCLGMRTDFTSVALCRRTWATTGLFGSRVDVCTGVVCMGVFLSCARRLAIAIAPADDDHMISNVSALALPWDGRGSRTGVSRLLFRVRFSFFACLGRGGLLRRGLTQSHPAFTVSHLHLHHHHRRWAHFVGSKRTGPIMVAPGGRIGLGAGEASSLGVLSTKIVTSSESGVGSGSGGSSFETTFL